MIPPPFSKHEMLLTRIARLGGVLDFNVLINLAARRQKKVVG